MWNVVEFSQDTASLADLAPVSPRPSPPRQPGEEQQHSQKGNGV